MFVFCSKSTVRNIFATKQTHQKSKHSPLPGNMPSPGGLSMQYQHLWVVGDPGGALPKGSTAASSTLLALTKHQQQG
jgi:hypothetical protein